MAVWADCAQHDVCTILQISCKLCLNKHLDAVASAQRRSYLVNSNGNSAAVLFLSHTIFSICCSIFSPFFIFYFYLFLRLLMLFWLVFVKVARRMRKQINYSLLFLHLLLFFSLLFLRLFLLFCVSLVIDALAMSLHIDDITNEWNSVCGFFSPYWQLSGVSSDSTASV